MTATSLTPMAAGATGIDFVVLVIAAMFLVTNVIVDLIVSIINPRIRLAERRAKS